MNCKWWEFFIGKPYEVVEEKFNSLEERASHLRMHITRLNERLDHIEDTLNILIETMGKR